MKRKEYMRLKLRDIPEEIINEYNLREMATPEEWVYLEISRGMYGLPQAGKLAQEQLEKRLNANGYKQSEIIPGLWTHIWRPISFTLVVDDFGVKYQGKEHAERAHGVPGVEELLSQNFQAPRPLRRRRRGLHVKGAVVHRFHGGFFR